MTIADANDKIAEKVVGGYKAVENAVTGGYKAVENAVTGGYKKVEDAFVDKFLRKEGETTEEAEARLKREQAERARSVSEKLACKFDRTDAGRRGSGATERKAQQEAEAKARAEKIAKMSGVQAMPGAKTTAEIQTNIKAKHNL